MTAVATVSTERGHWLDRYANDYHRWRLEKDQSGNASWIRRQGVVEQGFDTDGRYYGGRADVNTLLRLKASSAISPEQLQQRILLAWTVLRLEHVLLRAAAPIMTDSSEVAEPYFRVSCFNSSEEAIEDAQKCLVHVKDRRGRPVNDDEFYHHVVNTARVVDPNGSLSKLFVLPPKLSISGHVVLRFFFVVAHSVTDGLTMRVWLESFLRLINSPLHDLQTAVESLGTTVATKPRLPLAQEDLYPQISGSLARRRWFWCLSRVLRHVRRSLPAAFPNPLRRDQPFPDSRLYPPVYSDVLDYSSKPPLNTFYVRATVNSKARDRLVSICRQVGASVGAGGFALVALVMMILNERRNPGDQRPFMTGFPLNPRPFFNHMDPPDSMMLAFSDGIVLPFLPSHLDLEGRFRILVRHAQRQLSSFQKRARPEDTRDPLWYVGSRGPGRVIAINYLATVEKEQAKLPVERRNAVNGPQGSLEARPNESSQTCGVSSVGRTTQKPGMYDLKKPIGKNEDDFVADWFDARSSVRVRDDEFLCGVTGHDDGLELGVSVDGNAIDEKRADEWKHLIETIFDDEQDQVRPRL
ncbi:hypothetical protein PFICI_00697 [Pestalotiopsis fici W106-1]|uniref:Condensation domain-containing protein n=1 Tax=Pestalotiopsis fici (strain W106-1 / CGMCC3.15140) TaxID=1229662 RepID=W3XLJ3_PESFW|nr:uncharacterized protein PFICI_00697 [Pestalotiopsis fici W106-1]ETS86869.1 hypothetical protein PFICI_00697 [Pestalotiopsis fici W106-1]